MTCKASCGVCQGEDYLCPLFNTSASCPSFCAWTGLKCMAKCQGNAETWTYDRNRYFQCDAYDKNVPEYPGSRYSKCATDTNYGTDDAENTGLYAEQVCPQCDKCGLMAPGPVCSSHADCASGYFCDTLNSMA